MPHQTPAQRAMRARMEIVIGAVAPLLDLMLYAGDRVSRVAGRHDIDPEPPRRLDSSGTTREPDRLRRTV